MTSVAEYVMTIYTIYLKSNILIAFLIAILVGLALGAFNTIITTIATLDIY
jgi:simple sugar transport system permease protein